METLDARSASSNIVSNPTLENLRSASKGSILTPNDEGYALACSSWNLTIQHRPELVAVPLDEADVAIAVRYAKAHNMPICVQATGHGQPRHCTEGLLINMQEMSSVEIDRSAKIAKIGGGTQWQSVIEASVPLGLIPVSGSSPGVGVVGYTVGGGYGLLSRKYGLAADTVVSFRIVTSDGEVKSASPESHADLYWSVLGGGGAFGVITEITMRLVPEVPLFAGSVMFDASLAERVYPAFGEWAMGLPDSVCPAIVLITFPPAPFVPEFLHGRSMVIVMAAVVGEPAEASEWLSPIRSLPGAEFDSFRPISYLESATVFQDPVDPLPAKGRGVLLNDLDAEAMKRLLNAIGPAAQSPNLIIQLRLLGGALRQPGPHANAVGDRRRASYILYLLGVPMGPITPEAMKAHAEGVFADMAPYVLSRGPYNWIGEGDVEAVHVEEVYSKDELSRVVETKQAHDPSNLFRFAGVGLLAE